MVQKIRFLKFILGAFIVSTLFGLTVDALPNISCDPNADCLRNLGFFGKQTDPVCEIARTACRSKCERINSEAGQYQASDRSKISLLLQQRDSLVLSQSEEMIRITDFKADYLEISHSITQLDLIINNLAQFEFHKSEIEEFVNLAKQNLGENQLSIDELSKFSTRQNFSLEVQNYVNALKIAKQSILGIDKLVNEENSSAIISIISALMIKEKEMHVKQLGVIEAKNNESDIKIGKIKADREDIFVKIKLLEKDIIDQENRKCPPLI